MGQVAGVWCEATQVTDISAPDMDSRLPDSQANRAHVLGADSISVSDRPALHSRAIPTCVFLRSLVVVDSKDCPAWRVDHHCSCGSLPKRKSTNDLLIRSVQRHAASWESYILAE
jgi:hypothetical protein